MSDCFPCRNNAIEPVLLPLIERAYDDGLWRVAHAFNSALPGWMVVVTFMSFPAAPIFLPTAKVRISLPILCILRRSG